MTTTVADPGSSSWVDRLAAVLDRRWGVALAVLVGLAVLVRVPLLYERDLWLDEVDEYCRAAGGPLAELPDRVRATDRFPPAHAYLAAAVIACGGGPKDMRLVALAAGAGMVPLLWLLGRRTYGPAAGWLAAVLCAGVPSFVFFSREARPFALGLFALCGFLAGVCELLRRPRPGVLAGTIAAAMLVGLAQYASVVVAGVAVGVALGVCVTDRRRPPRAIAYLTVAAAALVLAGGWVYQAYALPQVSVRGTGVGQFAPYFSDLTRPAAFATFAVDRTVDLCQYAAVGGKLGPRWAWLSTAAIGTGLLAGLWRPGDRRRSWLVLSAALSVGAFLLMAGISKHPYGGTRHCMVLFPLVLVWFAGGATRLRGLAAVPPAAAAAALVGLNAVGVTTVVPAENRYQVSDVLPALLDRAGPTDTILLTSCYEITGFGYLTTGSPVEGMRVFGETFVGPVRRLDLPVRPAVLGVNLRQEDATGDHRVVPIDPDIRTVWVVDTLRSEQPPEPVAAGGRFEPTERFAAPGVRVIRWHRPVNDSR